VVAPAVNFGINCKSDNITSATTKSSPVRKIIGFGPITGAIFQALSLSYLIKKFSLDVYDFGSLLYLSANLATVFVAFFNYHKHPKIHDALAKYYFFACPLSLLFIGISAKINNYYPLLISVIAPILYFVGQLLLYKKYRRGNALMEVWAFSILSIWTLIMTFV